VSLANWSAWRILAIWMCWILLLVLIPIAALELTLRRGHLALGNASGGLAAIQFNVAPVAAIFLLLPPILLTVAWLGCRRRRPGSTM
jgi:hypothetical protein